MVGFNHIITFKNTGKVSDYQKAYNNNYSKTLKVYLPLNINNKKRYTALLYISINGTFPKDIKIIEGTVVESDLNCYMFDVSELYREYKADNKIGLAKFKLVRDDNRVKFQSESFRV